MFLHFFFLQKILIYIIKLLIDFSLEIKKNERKKRNINVIVLKLLLNIKYSTLALA